MTFPSDWALVHGWPDPMAEWRGGYFDDSPARNGLLEIFSDGFDSAGIPRATDVIEGDVGVISMLGHEAGAIFTGQRWAVVMPRGLAFVSSHPGMVLRAWRVCRG